MKQEKPIPKNQKYKFARDENFEDYSSGRVFYGAPMATNFPVRLASELFSRAREFLISKGNNGPYIIYDPFCGAGYSLAVIGLLHGIDIQKIVASDSDKIILEFTEKNLSLLSTLGMKKRIDELKKFIDEYDKTSHKEALESAQTLITRLGDVRIETEILQYNILTEKELPKSISNIDMIIADVPYGKMAEWDGLEVDMNPTQIFLDKIKYRLNEISVVAIISNKQQKIAFEGYSKITAFNLGKRKILILKPN